MLLYCSMVGPSLAQNVSVSPQRVVLEHGEKFAEMLIFNSGDNAALVRVSLRNLKMTKAGILVVSEEEATYFADDMLRVAPRQMKVEPKSRQVLRIVANKPGDLANGEYHTHIVVKVIPSLEKVQSASSASVEDDKSAISLLAITELVFPVIVRKGDALDAAIEIEAAQLITRDDGKSEVAIKLNRTGERSVIGDIRAYYSRDDGSPDEEIGLIKGVAIYTELDTRLIRLPLHQEALTKAGLTENSGGHIKVDFIETRGAEDRLSASHLVPLTR